MQNGHEGAGQEDRGIQTAARNGSHPGTMSGGVAVLPEGGRRHLGMRHYDVQLIGGSVLNAAKFEMKTGEGKTLVATLADI